MSRLSERSPIYSGAQRGVQATPAQITLHRNAHLGAKEVAKTARREMDTDGQVLDWLGLLYEELRGHQQ
jgi:hypothetical protein